MITYSLEGGSAVVTIDPKTGVIHTTAHLDYDMQTEYQVIVRATDSGTPPLIATATVKLQSIKAI